VAHELNEPLANILGFAQLAEQTPDLPAQAAQGSGQHHQGRTAQPRDDQEADDLRSSGAHAEGSWST
jgi:signal transduction histidine kinase